MLKQYSIRIRRKRLIPKYNHTSKVSTYLRHYKILEWTELEAIGVLTLERIFKLAKRESLKLKTNRAGFLNLKLNVLDGKSLAETIREETRKPEKDRNFDKILNLVEKV